MPGPHLLLNKLFLTPVTLLVEKSLSVSILYILASTLVHLSGKFAEVEIPYIKYAGLLESFNGVLPYRDDLKQTSFRSS